MNRKKVTTELKKKYGDQRFDLYKGHTMAGDYGWIVRPFGKNELYLGATLREAFDTIRASLEA